MRLVEWLRRLQRPSASARAARDPGPMQVVENRRFGVVVAIAQNDGGYCWRFPNAYMNWSEIYQTADDAAEAAKTFAEQRQVPISLW